MIKQISPSKIEFSRPKTLTFSIKAYIKSNTTFINSLQTIII